MDKIEILSKLSKFIVSKVYQIIGKKNRNFISFFKEEESVSFGLPNIQSRLVAPKFAAFPFLSFRAKLL